jgi:mono/diheme cytochrome c family protein
MSAQNAGMRYTVKHCWPVVLVLLCTGATAQTPDGQALYMDNCAACHGAALEGAPNWRQAGPDGVLPPPPHDETGHTWHHSDQFLFDYVKLGGQTVLDNLGVRFTSGMPAFENALTDAEIGAILDFIRSTWPAHIRAVQAERTAMDKSPR